MSHLKKGIRELLAEANGQIETISVEAARAEREAGESTIVDIRDVREVAREGRVAGAVHAPRGMLEFWIDPESPYHREDLSSAPRLVLYCASGWRSALATKTLQDMGVENVAHIEGGFTAWRDAGGPIEKRDGSDSSK